MVEQNHGTYRVAWNDQGAEKQILSRREFNTLAEAQKYADSVADCYEPAILKIVDPVAGVVGVKLLAEILANHFDAHDYEREGLMFSIVGNIAKNLPEKDRAAFIHDSLPGVAEAWGEPDLDLVHTVNGYTRDR